MKLKKLLAFTLALAMVLSTMGFTVLANSEYPTENWIDGADISWYTEGETSYTISTAAELAGLAKLVNEGIAFCDKDFNSVIITLDDDIDLDGKMWTPIGGGEANKTFAGIFDGGNNTISNLIVTSSYGNVGLFGRCAMNADFGLSAEVKNFTVYNAIVKASGQDAVGAAVGYGHTELKVTNVNVTGTLDIFGYRGVAAIVGKGYADIYNCTVEAEGTIASQYWCAGGILGHSDEPCNEIINSKVIAIGNGLVIDGGSYVGAGAVCGYVVEGSTVRKALVKDIVIKGDSYYYGGYACGNDYKAEDVIVVNVQMLVGDEPHIPGDAEDVVEPVAKVGDTYYATVQEAVDAAEVGATEIQLLSGTIDENVVIYQVEGKNIVVKGSDDITYTGSFHICGNNRYNAEETVVFDGINFNGADKTAAHDFITSTRREYVGATLVWGVPHNVTVKNCSFVGNYANQTDEEYAGKEVVALRNVGGYNWTVENCTATGLHSFMQASANYKDESKPEKDYVSEISGVTVTSSKSGLNLGTNANYIITDSTFNVKEYAIRVDANSDRNVEFSVTGCDITAENALIVRKADTANKSYNVAVNKNKIISSGADIVRDGGNDTDTISFNYGFNYWGGGSAVTTGINDALVVDSFAYYIDENMTQVGGAAAKIGDDYYETIAHAIDAAEAGDTITIFAGEYNGFDVPAELNNVTFVGETDAEGNNLVTIKTLEEGVTSHNGGIFVQSETSTFKNLNFTAGTVAGARSGWMTSSIGNTNGDTGMRSNLENLTIENCNFVGSGEYQAIWTNQGNITLKNSTITNYKNGIDNYAIGADQKVVIEGSEITDVYNAFHTGEAEEGAEIVVTDTDIDSEVIDIGGAVAVIVTESTIENAAVTTYAASTFTVSDSALKDTSYALAEGATGTIILNNNYVNNVKALEDGAEKSESITFETYYKTEKDLEEKKNLKKVGATAHSIGGLPGGSGGGIGGTQYTVTFETNGGSNVAKLHVKKGDSFARPDAPTKEGFVFEGWYTDKNLTDKYDFTAKVTSDLVLYANWIEADEDTETTGFIDLDAEAWYYDVVNTAIAKGLMNGVSATEFAPNTNLTRGMFVTILYRADGKMVVEGESTFSDVLEGQYYTDAVIWAAANGIVTGMAEEVFAPDENVTREQMATMISRYLAYKEIEISKEGAVVYTDDAQIADWAMDAVAEMKRAGLLEGNADGSFAPKRNATRAEAAALFVRLLNIL